MEPSYNLLYQGQLSLNFLIVHYYLTLVSQRVPLARRIRPVLISLSAVSLPIFGYFYCALRIICYKVLFRIKNYFLKVLRNNSLRIRFVKHGLRLKVYNRARIYIPVFLYITFKKRNAFFNLSLSGGQTIKLTTLRKEGYVGRRRLEYTSLFSVMRSMRTILADLMSKNRYYFCLIYSG